MRFAMRRDTVLSLLGCPAAQRHQIETQYAGGISQFVQDCVEAVFARLPLSRQLFLAGLHDGPLYAGVLPGIPQAGELPEASRRTGRSRPDAYRFGAGLLEEGPAADFAVRAPGSHGLACHAAAAAAWRRSGSGSSAARRRSARISGGAPACGPSSSIGRRSWWTAGRARSANCSPTIAPWPKSFIPNAAYTPTAASTLPTWPPSKEEPEQTRKEL